MKKTVFITLLLVGVFLLMAFTRPDRQQHCQAVTEQVEKAVNQFSDENMPQNKGLSAIGSAISRVIVGAVTEPLVDSYIDYHNYVVCSTSTITYHGQTKMLSFGMFGNVVTIDKDKILQYLRDAKADIIGSVSSLFPEITH